METIWIETEFARVHGRLSGRPHAPLLLGIHGWSRRNGWHTWEPLHAPLAAAGFRVVSVDMPGWGKSALRHSAGLSRRDAVETVRQILDELGVETVALMGKSWGGGVALETAVTHPARVSKLILSAPAYSGHARLTSLRQPVLLVWAEDDEVIPLSQADQYLAGLPEAKLVTFPTGGHSAAPNNAAAFVPQAVRFLQNEPDPAR